MHKSIFQNERNTNFMFSGCSLLTTIYASDKFVTTGITGGYGSNMFSGCPNLVGGNNTSTLHNPIDKTYARIDGKDNLPGYFTER